MTTGQSFTMRSYNVNKRQPFKPCDHIDLCRSSVGPVFLYRG